MASMIRLAALIAGISYLWVIANDVTGAPAVIWKGAGVALLAIYALASGSSNAHRWIAAVLSCGAAGDVLLETHGLIVGAIAFSTGHLLATWFYLGQRRDQLVPSQMGLAGVMLIMTPVIAWMLTQRIDIAAYAWMLGSMAASAWISRFSRYSVGIGAVLFVISDLLIFARMGPFAGMASVSLAIWALYFAGQYMIATGVVAALDQRQDLR
jgi:hypothetical protein